MYMVTHVVGASLLSFLAGIGLSALNMFFNGLGGSSVGGLLIGTGGGGGSVGLGTRTTNTTPRVHTTTTTRPLLHRDNKKRCDRQVALDTQASTTQDHLLKHVPVTLDAKCKSHRRSPLGPVTHLSDPCRFENQQRFTSTERRQRTRRRGRRKVHASSSQGIPAGHAENIPTGRKTKRSTQRPNNTTSLYRRRDNPCLLGSTSKRDNIVKTLERSQHR